MELEEYLEQACARPESQTDETSSIRHTNLLALVQSIKALSSGIELKDYIRTKRQEIVELRRQRSASQSLSSDRSSGELDRLQPDMLTEVPVAETSCAATIQEAQQRAAKRARTDEGDYLITEAPPLNAVVLMGVAGSGKTRVGRDAAQRSGWHFTDADDYHPPENVAKMARGEGLTDEDRQGWLAAVRSEISATVRSGGHRIIACSALKRSYRDYLLGDADHVEAGRAVAVYLRVTEGTARGRLAMRQGHFAGPDLAGSQFATLEQPEADEPVVEVDAEQHVDHVVGNVAAMLQGTR